MTKSVGVTIILLISAALAVVDAEVRPWSRGWLPHCSVFASFRSLIAPSSSIPLLCMRLSFVCMQVSASEMASIDYEAMIGGELLPITNFVSVVLQSHRFFDPL